MAENKPRRSFYHLSREEVRHMVGRMVKNENLTAGSVAGLFDLYGAALGEWKKARRIKGLPVDPRLPGDEEVSDSSDTRSNDPSKFGYNMCPHGDRSIDVSALPLTTSSTTTKKSVIGTRFHHKGIEPLPLTSDTSFNIAILTLGFKNMWLLGYLFRIDRQKAG